jgi:hypothetical protein
MSIPAPVIRLLLAHSAGYCQNPSCNRDLFVFFENGEITNIDELAHIIAQKPNGPRGKDNIEGSQLDEYANVILLCPTCHTTIDKNPDQFPIHLLHEWKAEHTQRIKTVFGVPVYKARADLRKEIKQLLRRNHQIFLTYGPHSETALDPLTDAAKMWMHFLQVEILPNNRRLAELLIANDNLLSPGERTVVDQFIVHKSALEYNHLLGDKNSSAPLFPTAMGTILEE